MLKEKPKKKIKSDYLSGIKDGLPIGLGYLSVSFAFGIFTVEQGLKVFQAVLMSMTNLTSAGQLAGVTLIVAGGAFSELALSQLVINIRYSLMSTILSQKFDNSMRLIDRFFLSFAVTDEVFAVASSKKSVGRSYIRGLILLPYIGWSVGTLCGALMGNILPAILVSALGIAIYGMFVAIVVPETKKNFSILGVVAVAVGINCLIRFTPLSNHISNGFAVIIAALLSAIIFALIKPIENFDEEEEQND